MGPCGSQFLKPFAYKSFFLPNGPHKTAFGTEILKIKILTIFWFVFVNMEPNRSQKFKTLLLLQIATKSFQTS